MPHKLIKYKPIGMNRDLSISAANPKYAYTINNMRIINNEETGDLSLINEKGTTLKLKTSGIVTGMVEANDQVVLFGVTDERMSFIDLLDEESLSTGEIKNLYEGNLNFSIDHPIEGIFNYETESIQKVYWVDGINPLRIINIAATEGVKRGWTDTSFDINIKTPYISNTYVEITKNKISSGQFPGGTVLYFMTYTNYNQVESPIVYISKKYYTTDTDGAALSPEEISINSFKITVSLLDTLFKYINLYSVVTSGYSSRDVKFIGKARIYSNTEKVEFTDTNTKGETINISDLLFKKVSHIKPNTIQSKQNVLFLGNYELGEAQEDASTEYGENILLSGQNIEIIEAPHINFDSPDYLYQYDPIFDSVLKGGETYRLGIFFLDDFGNRSNIFYLGDHIMNKYPKYSNKYGLYKHFFLLLLKENDAHTGDFYDIFLDIMSQYNYTSIIPVICYPELHERTVICLGVLNPTIFNLDDRDSELNPFACSSYFFRPILMQLMNQLVSGGDPSPVEFRHMFSIESCAYTSDYKMLDLGKEYSIATPSSSLRYSAFASGHGYGYWVDNSIVTLNSPDLELSEELDNFDFSGCQCRIVGYIPIDSRRSFYTMALNHDVEFNNTVKDYFNISDYARASWHDLHSKFRLYLGDARHSGGGTSPGMKLFKDYPLYPWNSPIVHPLFTNEDIDKLVSANYTVSDYRPVTLGELKYSRYSSLLITSMSRYFAEPNYLYLYNKELEIIEDQLTVETHKGITTPKLFNSNEYSPIYIPHPADNKKQVIYNGNVDKILTNDTGNTCHVQYKSSKHLVFSIKYLEGSDGYLYHQILPTPFKIRNLNMYNEDHIYAANSVRDYALDCGTSTDNFWNVSDTNYTHTDYDYTRATFGKYIGEKTDGYNWGFLNNTKYSFYAEGIILDALDLLDYYGNTYNINDLPVIDDNDKKLDNIGILWIGEIYKDISPDIRFGGKSKEALLNNTWYIAGPAYTKNERQVRLTWSYGDTYISRFDSLKTYSGGTENKNNVTEILSFYCESHVNPDSRYDNNRNKNDNTPMTPLNFNLVNPVYSLPNKLTDVFNYTMLPNEFFDTLNFKTDIVWSLPKKAGEDIDAWSKINTVSSISLEGKYGKINAIRKLNDSLIIFQDRGISNLLFNENVQIASTTGVPIEIANSGKVDGYRILSDVYGCANKWSIQNTKNGLYFVDDYNKDIVFFNGQFKSLSREKGFNSWINYYIDNDATTLAFSLTTPSKFGNIITHYDKVTDDLYFTTETESLNYSEVLNEFQAFLSYGGTFKLFNLKGNSYLIQNDTNNLLYNIHLMFAGDYNNLLDQKLMYYIELLVNPEPTEDKVFNTVEFRSDSWEWTNGIYGLSNKTFNSLEINTEYQSGYLNLDFKKGYPSNLKRKFRIWRANIPRDNNNYRDRIRNTWAKIKLGKGTPNKEKTVLHDIQISYFV